MDSVHICGYDFGIGNRLISRKTKNIPHTNQCELNTFWMSKLCTFEVRKTKNQTCLDAQVHICTLTPGHGFIPGASRSQPWLSITTCAGTAECGYRYGAWTPADTMWIRSVRSMVTQVDRLWLDEKKPFQTPRRWKCSGSRYPAIIGDPLKLDQDTAPKYKLRMVDWHLTSRSKLLIAIPKALQLSLPLHIENPYAVEIWDWMQDLPHIRGCSAAFFLPRGLTWKHMMTKYIYMTLQQ